MRETNSKTSNKRTKMKNSLIVAETFYSLQCEGRAVGTPAVFLRLGGCNLLCNSEHWRCDTIEVWQKGKLKTFEKVLPIHFIDRLRKGAHLVITGGEPLLHQEAIVDYISWIYMYHDFLPFVEIETNGTILPIPALLEYVTWWNVSPKLSNSGEPAEKRINEVALECLKFEGASIFKFVVKNEEDILEVLQEFGMLNFKDVMLMPAGATRKELDETRPFVAMKAIELNLRYSERLHIVIWDRKTGV